jgi:putative ABC transport system substrate-binding protein
MPVIGFLSSTSPEAYASRVAAFQRGLREAGYVEGQNVAIEYHWAEGLYDRLPRLAADHVGRKVDVIATLGGMPSGLAAKSATDALFNSQREQLVALAARHAVPPIYDRRSPSRPRS